MNNSISTLVSDIKKNFRGGYKTYEIFQAGNMRSLNPNLLKEVPDDLDETNLHAFHWEVMDKQTYKAKILLQSRWYKDNMDDEEFPCLVIYIDPLPQVAEKKDAEKQTVEK